MNVKIYKKGFSLVELIVVISILGVLAAILVPLFFNFIEESKEGVDRANLRILNTSTKVYGLSAGIINSDIFEGISTDALRMEKLITQGYLTTALKAQKKDKDFKWKIDSQEWLYDDINNIVNSNQISMGIMGQKGYLKGSYSGSSKDIIIPTSIDGTVVTQIYQDVFSDKGLTSVVFEEDSEITRIHARAFSNNNLTEIVLPKNLQRIDTYSFSNNNLTEIVLPNSLESIETMAFRDNDITKITIGADVQIKNNVFQNNNSFKTVYEEQGAGSYVFIDGNWVKQ